MREEKLGGLDCVVTGGPDGRGGGDGPLVVLLHGFGAPGTDLVSLAGVLDVPREVRFVFPAAPLELPGFFADSRAWWMIDMARLEEALMSGRERDLGRDVPAGMPEARSMITKLLDDSERLLGARGERTVLGGFSQGAMLSTDTALHSTRPLAGLLLMSGTLLAEDEWVKRLPARAGLRVLMSHGTRDPLLPFANAERLRQHMLGAGLRVDFVEFRGAHEIPREVLLAAGQFVREVTV